MDHDVESVVPLVAAGGHDDGGIAGEVSGFFSSGPVQKWTVSSTHTATSGVTCGRPSVRTVVIQDGCAVTNFVLVFAQGVG
jgi:hypothetical protein